MRTLTEYRTTYLPFFVVLVYAFSLSGCSDESSQALLAQARTSLKAGDRKAALIQLKSAVQKDEQNGEARFELAQLQMQTGDMAAAEKELRRAREYGVSTDSVNPLLAQVLLKLGEYQRVLDEIPLPAEGSEGEEKYLIARTNAQLSLKQVEEARKSLQRAIDIAPGHPDVQLAAARLALTDRNVDQAFEHIKLALDSDPKHLESWLMKADLLRASGKPEEAGAAYQTALTIDPEHIGARLALAEIALRQNSLAESRKQVDQVLSKAPRNLMARYTQAQIDFREKKYAEARDHLAEVTKTAPNFLPAMLLSGSIEYALGNMQTAEAYLDKVVKAVPKNVYAMKLLAASQLKQGRPNDAQRSLDPALRLAPEDVGVHIVAGEIAMAKKAFGEATQHFQIAAQNNPDSAVIRTQLGFSRLVGGDSRAMADLQSASSMGNGDKRADTLIILSQLKDKQYDAALSSIAGMEKKFGATPMIWNYRGAAYLGKQNTPQARASFGEALKLDPTFFPAIANLAKLDLQEKRIDLAQQRFDALLKSRPNHLDAMLALADIAMIRKDEKSYQDWLKKATSAHPSSLQPKLLLTRYLLGKGQPDQALAFAREAVNLQPKNPVALNFLGMAQFASKDLENARGTYQKLADMYPDRAEPKLQLAQIQISSKQFDQARLTLQQAIRLKPDFVPAQLVLGSLEIQTARYDDALNLAKQLQQKPQTTVPGLLMEGQVAMKREQYQIAIPAFEKAHKLAASATTLVQLFHAYERLGRMDDGNNQLSAWLVRQPQDYGTRLLLAESLTRQGKYKTAAEQYLYLNQQYPGNLVVLNNLAFTLSELKDKRALSFAEQALKLKPESAAVMDTLGWILVQQGQSARGIKLLQQALSKVPDAAEIHYHLAVAYNITGDRSRARQELKRLLDGGKTFPQEKTARDLLKQLGG